MINIKSIVVNHAWIGMDPCYAYEEAIGTLIHTLSHGIVIKTSDTECRSALLNEIATWTGPISPGWAAYYAGRKQ